LGFFSAIHTEVLCKMSSNKSILCLLLGNSLKNKVWLLYTLLFNKFLDNGCINCQNYIWWEENSICVSWGVLNVVQHLNNPKLPAFLGYILQSNKKNVFVPTNLLVLGSLECSVRLLNNTRQSKFPTILR